MLAIKNEVMQLFTTFISCSYYGNEFIAAIF